MKISKDLSWIREYIEEIHFIVPELRKLKRISSRVPNKKLNTNQHCHGIITKYYNGVDHRITIYTKYLNMSLVSGKVELEIKPYSKIDTLCYIAHEIAHLRFWEHTPDHKSLEATIILIFMNRLKISGYKCEEDELSYYTNCRKLKEEK